ncbi:MAG: transglycosylase SLT domain-containing protein, partial [Solirubrobacterales bacterium]
VTAAAGEQRAVDLAALSAARSMRDDLPRLLAPAVRADGSTNPAHMGRAEYFARARAAALEAVDRNGLPAREAGVEFPDRASAVPVKARVELHADPRRWALAQASPPEATAPMGAAEGDYTGPLASRQGKPMRPDVAAAFDRLEAAAARAGIALVIGSAYRSDAEQARLFAANPDPRWVARPGTSLHRCGTELDLGPAAAYGWLAANAPRFGFVKRYSWEPWHFGYDRGPAPCSAASGAGGGDGAAPPAVPTFVPGAYRAPIVAAAARWDVSAGLLAAQLMAESGFDPGAVSPAGAQGIAQFMPATAAAYGLRDPFDPRTAIDAQAHLMSDLLQQFGQVPLALAAYNAGPAPVAACDCVPAYPETQAYVARILALMGGAGEWAQPLEVRLVG